MKIDEAWIRKAAGWKATKAGKEIYQRGSVSEVTQNGSVITGAISGGSAKPTRITVRIHSDTDIDTVCPRMACRRTGELCQHAVAILFASALGLREKEERAPGVETSVSTTKPRVPQKGAAALPADIPVPMIQLEFSPKFPDGMPDGGLSLRLTEGGDHDHETTEPDRSLAEWLIRNAGGKVPPMMSLKGAGAMEFLKVIGGHPRLAFGGKRLQIATQGVRVPLSFELDDDRAKLSLPRYVLERGRVWYAGSALWLWESEQGILMVVKTQGSLSDRMWSVLANHGSVAVPMKQFLTGLSELEDCVLWEDDAQLQQIPITQQEPQIRLEILGSTQSLRARLIATYAAGVEVMLGLFSQQVNEFPVADPKHPGFWLDRNTDSEDNAAGRLMGYGFQLSGAEGDWTLEGDDAVLEFLSAGLKRLEEDWKVVTAGKLRSLKGNLVRVRPNIKLEGSGEDWLAFDYGFQTEDGKDIPREAIEKMLRAGKRSATTKNGKQVVISNFDAEIMESVLRDTDPRQEGGRYYVQKAQGSYLKRLKDFYGGTSQELVGDSSLIARLPERVSSKLRDYQAAGISWLHQRCVDDGAALLADDMGLGKTLQTLSLLQLIKKPGEPSLVVCPRSLLANWEDEVQHWMPELKVKVMHGTKRHDAFEGLSDYDLVITSYALVAKDLQHYQNLTLNAVVLDEASIIRNPNTQNAKALRKLPSQLRVALTGTPVENAVRDLWSLFAFLLPGYLGSKEDFAQRYEAKLAGGESDPNALRRLRMRTAPFMIRRTKAEVAKDLPKKMEQVLWCEPSALQRKTYAELMKKGAELVSDAEGGKARMQMLTTLLRLRQASCDLRLLGGDAFQKESVDDLSAKLTMLVELLQEAKRGGHRVLVFSQFTKALTLIKTALDENEISYAYLDGSTRNRGAEVKKFQQANGPDTFLISLKAGGYGLNLTAADTVVHFDPWWNPAVEAQATDRAYRIGQTKPVTVYKMIAKGTVEEKILRLQEKKRGVIGAAVGDEAQPMMTGLSEEELRGLLL